MFQKYHTRIRRSILLEEYHHIIGTWHRRVGHLFIRSTTDSDSVFGFRGIDHLHNTLYIISFAE